MNDTDRMNGRTAEIRAVTKNSLTHPCLTAIGNGQFSLCPAPTTVKNSSRNPLALSPRPRRVRTPDSYTAEVLFIFLLYNIRRKRAWKQSDFIFIIRIHTRKNHLLGEHPIIDIFSIKINIVIDSK